MNLFSCFVHFLSKDSHFQCRRVVRIMVKEKNGIDLTQLYANQNPGFIRFLLKILIKHILKVMLKNMVTCEICHNKSIYQKLTELFNMKRQCLCCFGDTGFKSQNYTWSNVIPTSHICFMNRGNNSTDSKLNFVICVSPRYPDTESRD